MTLATRSKTPIAGLTAPAAVGDRLEDIHTPALIIDLDAFDRNIARMRGLAEAMGVRLRAHAKAHKSADIARIQLTAGGARGICCQKVSEAAAFVEAGVVDILISNQIVEAKKIDILAGLAARARIIVCVDDAQNVADLAEAARRRKTTIECLVEIDCGFGRCGVLSGEPAVTLAKAIAASDGLRFTGLQAYQGAAQHMSAFSDRRAAIDTVLQQVSETRALLSAAGLSCEIIGGAGTGTYALEGESGLFNELQCGSYIFMDAAYNRVLDENGRPMSDFENSLFLWTSIMSKARPDRAVCDAGLKVQSVDSGLPVIHGREDVRYVKCSDEHGIIEDPNNRLRLRDKLKLIPGHCDPTCNIHDWYVGVRNGLVECLWPVTARGLSW